VGQRTISVALPLNAEGAREVARRSRAASSSNLAGGALVVAGVDRIHRPQLQQSVESLETAGAHLFGML
jgi:hypothetical protein